MRSVHNLPSWVPVPCVTNRQRFSKRVASCGRNSLYISLQTWRGRQRNCINSEDSGSSSSSSSSSHSSAKSTLTQHLGAWQTTSSRTNVPRRRKDVWLTAMRCLRDWHCRAGPLMQSMHYNACASVEKLRRVSSEARTAAPGCGGGGSGDRSCHRRWAAVPACDCEPARSILGGLPRQVAIKCGDCH